MQQLQQLAVPPPMRPPPGTPTLSHQNSTPGHTMQQLSRSHPMRSSPVTNQSVSGSMRSSPMANQSVSTPPVQPVRDAADFFSGPSPRPPLISPITPTPNPAPSRPPLISAITPSLSPITPTPNPSPSRPPLISAITPSPNPTRPGGEIRSAAPHLQPFRATSSTHSATSPSPFQTRPHSQPVILQPPLPPPPPRAPSTNFVSQSGIPSPSIPNLSSLELVKEMDRRAFMHENRPSSPLPEICSNFGSLELSDLETLGNVQGNQTSGAVATDVVCLSDDD